MDKKEPSIGEFIAWINQLDDPYKIFVWTLINVISLFTLTTIGIGIDKDFINEFVAGTIIETYGDKMLNFIWSTAIQPVLLIVGVIQLIISLYAISKFRWLGVIISVTGFIGWVLIIFRLGKNWSEVLWIGIILVIISYVFARYSSKLDFDQEGRVLMD